MKNKIVIPRNMILWLSLFASACTFAKHKSGDVPEGVSHICAEQIDFRVIEQSILAPKCFACHGAGAGNLNLNTYAAVQANFTRIQSLVQSGAMPPGKPLPANEKALLTTWESAGLPEVAAGTTTACNDTGTGTDPDPGVIPIPVLEPNFESIRKMILEPRCLACHGEGSGLDFSSYAQLISYTELFESKPGEDGPFVDAVASGFMPPKKNPKLTEAEVSVIRQWVVLGLPERPGSGSVVVNPPPPVAPPPVVNPVDPIPPDLTCLDFKTIQATVLEPKCVGCHGDSGGVNLESYASVKNHLSKIEVMVSTGKMPPKKPLDAALKDQLLAWIQSGAPETPASCTPPEVEPPPPLEPTYNSMKLHFLEQKCIVCHSGSAPRALADILKKGGDDDDDDDDDDKPDFSTYKKMIANKKLFDFKKPHKSKIVDEVLDGDMPPSWSSAKQLTQLEIQTLIEWINRGLPEG